VTGFTPRADVVIIDEAVARVANRWLPPAILRSCARSWTARRKMHAVRASMTPRLDREFETLSHWGMILEMEIEVPDWVGTVRAEWAQGISP
jgi:hypothetical protein